MSQMQPKIYHITPLENLHTIIQTGWLFSDAQMIARGIRNTNIGMSEIKLRRLELPVGGLDNVCVGDCVPFYFCPRSIMLFILHCRNHPSLTYRGGQENIVHLEADLLEVVEYAKQHRQPWAFSLSNAGAVYTEFRTDLEQLSEINRQAVTATDFRSGEMKEGKQAEFLLHGAFPWSLVRRIGVKSDTIKTQVQTLLESAPHQPLLEWKPNWYY
jgi:hypothetical protein